MNSFTGSCGLGMASSHTHRDTVFLVWFGFLKIFLMWAIFKVLVEFVTILLLFYVLVFWPQAMWDLSSPTRDRTHTLCIGRRSLNHWTAREVPDIVNLASWFFPQGPGCGLGTLLLDPAFQAI